MKANDLTYNFIKETVLKQSYDFNIENFGLNLVAFRTNNRLVDNWDDVLTMTWLENGSEKIIVFHEYTTDPGIYYMTIKLLNPLGCGILKKGQYKKMFKEGIHQGKYRALVQANPVTVYRDRNKDNFMDMDPTTEYTGMYAINLHHGYTAMKVNNNSALCQVLRRQSEHDILMKQYDKHKALYGTYIDYTLIHEEDV